MDDGLINIISELAKVYNFEFNNSDNLITIKKLQINNKKKPNSVISTDHIKESVDYLNEKMGTRYKHTATSTQRLLKKILSEYTLQDVKTVIDIKVAAWRGTDMEVYIRPATLFAMEKFENYLNEKPKGSALADFFDEPWEDK